MKVTALPQNPMILALRPIVNIAFLVLLPVTIATLSLPHPTLSTIQYLSQDRVLSLFIKAIQPFFPTT
jgi:hypothetical protein